MDEQEFIAQQRVALQKENQQNLPELTCKYCQNKVSELDYFCPNCGKKLKDKPLSTGIGRQIIVYLISFFLPPFGLPFAYRYFKQDDDKAWMIGFAVIGLTVLSVIINVWLIIGFVNQTTSSMNDIYKQMDQMQSGY